MLICHVSCVIIYTMKQTTTFSNNIIQSRVYIHKSNICVYVIDVYEKRIDKNEHMLIRDNNNEVTHERT